MKSGEARKLRARVAELERELLNTKALLDGRAMRAAMAKVEARTRQAIAQLNAHTAPLLREAVDKVVQAIVEDCACGLEEGCRRCPRGEIQIPIDNADIADDPEALEAAGNWWVCQCRPCCGPRPPDSEYEEPGCARWVRAARRVFATTIEDMMRDPVEVVDGDKPTTLHVVPDPENDPED